MSENKTQSAPGGCKTCNGRGWVDDLWTYAETGKTRRIWCPECQELGTPQTEAVQWVLVPREPTEGMMQAGLYQSSHDAKWEDVYSSWVDMVDHAKSNLEPPAMSRRDDILAAANLLIAEKENRDPWVRDLLHQTRRALPTPRAEMSADAQAAWSKYYDIPDHLGWDLRMIADRTDERAGYATMDASRLRCAAMHFDGMPEETTGDEAMRLAREAALSLEQGEKP